MCRIFIGADPESYESRTRSVRLHGVVTSVRLENLHQEEVNFQRAQAALQRSISRIKVHQDAGLGAMRTGAGQR